MTWVEAKAREALEFCDSQGSATLVALETVIEDAIEEAARRCEAVAELYSDESHARMVAQACAAAVRAMAAPDETKEGT